MDKEKSRLALSILYLCLGLAWLIAQLLRPVHFEGLLFTILYVSLGVAGVSVSTFNNYRKRRMGGREAEK